MQSFMKYLKYTCLLENDDYARFGPKYTRKNIQKSKDSSLLHTSSSSRSSLSPDSSLEGFFTSPREGAMDSYFTSLEDNPEALFDILTIQSMQERYSDSDKTEVGSEKFADVTSVNDQDFENFVREFPIDDSISECFASDHFKPDTIPINSKYGNTHVRQNKLKKKHVPNGIHDNHVLSDDDSKSSDSKRSKLGNLFHRKQKGKEQHTEEQEVEKHKNGIMGNVKDSNGVPGITDIVKREDKYQTTSKNQTSPRKLPPLPKMNGAPGSSTGSVRGSVDCRRSRSSTSTQQEVKYWFTIIDVEDDEDKIIQTLSSWPDVRLRRIRDGQGNTLLHRATIANKTKVMAELGSKFQELTYDLNYDRLSSIELAVQFGKLEALETLLTLQYGSNQPPSGTVAKLMDMAAKKGESACLQRLVAFLPRSGNGQITLPQNSDGDTAAHVAAANGRVACLHVLIEHGYSGWSENSKGLHPLHLAVHNNEMACYHFLLLHQCCKCLLRDRDVDGLAVKRLRRNKINTQSAVEQLEQRLVRHLRNVQETMTTTTETQQTITQCLDTIYAKIEGLISETDPIKGEQLRIQLDNIRAEGERLQDLFEFSPLGGTGEMLGKIIKDFSSVLVVDSEKSESDTEPSIHTDHVRFITTVAEEVKKVLPTSKDIIHDIEVIAKHVVTKSLGQSESPEQTTEANTTTIKPKEKEVKFSTDLPTNRPPEIENCRAELVVRDVPSFSHRQISRNQENRIFHLADEESVCSNTLTLTSGITGTERTSDWTSRVDTVSADSSDSESDWWEDARRPTHRRRRRSADDDDEDDDFYGDDFSYNNVVLNLENEDASDDVLREHRLAQHLQAMERFNTERSDMVETVVTASGRRLGGRAKPDPSYIDQSGISHTYYAKPNAKSNVVSMLPKRGKSKERHRSKIKLFNHEDVQESVEMSQSEFRESCGRTADRSEKRWDEVSLTDVDDTKENDKAWYEMSEDEESIIQTWRSDEEDNQSRDYRQFIS